jgi:hypothetical protein
MSESWVVLELPVALYAAVRACQNSRTWGVAARHRCGIVAAVVMRAAMLRLLAVVALAIALSRTGSAWRWNEQG